MFRKAIVGACLIMLSLGLQCASASVASAMSHEDRSMEMAGQTHLHEPIPSCCLFAPVRTTDVATVPVSAPDSIPLFSCIRVEPVDGAQVSPPRAYRIDRHTPDGDFERRSTAKRE